MRRSLNNLRRSDFRAGVAAAQAFHYLFRVLPSIRFTTYLKFGKKRRRLQRCSSHASTISNHRLSSLRSHANEIPRRYVDSKHWDFCAVCERFRLIALPPDFSMRNFFSSSFRRHTTRLLGKTNRAKHSRYFPGSLLRVARPVVYKVSYLHDFRGGRNVTRKVVV